MTQSSEDEFFWENEYLLRPLEALSWNAGHADPDLVRWVENGTIPRSQALDVGTGPGHDSVFLLEKGFDVIGIDISPSAIRLTRENASRHGFFGYFQTADVRKLPIENAYIDFTFDRGCLQGLSKTDQEKAMAEIARVLNAKGLFLLKARCEKVSQGMSRSALEALARPLFNLVEFQESIFEGPVSSPGYTALLRKK